MSLEKAVIEIDEKDRGPNLPARITVQFNPTEYSLSKGAQIAEINIPGLDSPILQFVRGQNEKLTLELFFDSTSADIDSKDGQLGSGAVSVTEMTKSIYQLVKVQPKTHAPPRIRFCWGENKGGLNFKALVESVQQEF